MRHAIKYCESESTIVNRVVNWFVEFIGHTMSIEIHSPGLYALFSILLCGADEISLSWKLEQ